MLDGNNKKRWKYLHKRSDFIWTWNLSLLCFRKVPETSKHNFRCAIFPRAKDGSRQNLSKIRLDFNWIPSQRKYRKALDGFQLKFLTRTTLKAFVEKRAHILQLIYKFTFMRMQNKRTLCFSYVFALLFARYKSTHFQFIKLIKTQINNFFLLPRTEKNKETINRYETSKANIKKISIGRVGLLGPPYV